MFRVDPAITRDVGLAFLFARNVLVILIVWQEQQASSLAVSACAHDHDSFTFIQPPAGTNASSIHVVSHPYTCIGVIITVSCPSSQHHCIFSSSAPRHLQYQRTLFGKNEGIRKKENVAGIRDQNSTCRVCCHAPITPTTVFYLTRRWQETKSSARLSFMIKVHLRVKKNNDKSIEYIYILGKRG